MSQFKKDPIEYNQKVLFPTNIFDLLSKGHECYIYKDLIDLLDTKDVEKKYSYIGQNAYHPRLILGILIYAYSHGVFSSREIEKRCNEDLGFMYISHLNCPNFRVLSDFRKINYEFFKLCFVQTVKLARESGLASLGHVSLDGSKFKADSSKHKAMSYKRLKESDKELTDEIDELLKKASLCDEEEDADHGKLSGYEISEELKIKEKRQSIIRKAKDDLEKRESEMNSGKEIDEKKQISFADPDAMIMGDKGKFEYSYNGQISVDKDNQIIVGEHLSRISNDKQEVEPALSEISSSTGKLPDTMSLDNGYMSGKNLEKFSETEIDVYIATGKGEPMPEAIEEKNKGKKNQQSESSEEKKIVKFRKEKFRYDIKSDTFICPGNKQLEFKTQYKNGTKIYQGEKEICLNCKYYNRCCNVKTGKARIINSDDKEAFRQEMKDKMKLESSREIYKKRKAIVEPVFGQIKHVLGFRGFCVRGYKKVCGEFSLICGAHNIKKIVTSIKKGVVRPNGGKLLKNGG